MIYSKKPELFTLLETGSFNFALTLSNVTGVLSDHSMIDSRTGKVLWEKRAKGKTQHVTVVSNGDILFVDKQPLSNSITLIYKRDSKNGAFMASKSGSGPSPLLTINEEVSCVQPLPDNRVALGFQKGTIEILDAQKMIIIATLSGHSGLISGLLCPREGTLISSSYDGSSIIWDLLTNEMRQQLVNYQPYDPDIEPHLQDLLFGRTDAKSAQETQSSATASASSAANAANVDRKTNGEDRTHYREKVTAIALLGEREFAAGDGKGDITIWSEEPCRVFELQHSKKPPSDL